MSSIILVFMFSELLTEEFGRRSAVNNISVIFLILAVRAVGDPEIFKPTNYLYYPVKAISAEF